MIKKKKIFYLTAIAVVLTGFACGLCVSSNDPIFESNVEALARDEGGPSCTGPKKQNLSGAIFCHCENTVSCRDTYGCN